MRRNAYLFGGTALLAAAAGMLLRITELTTLLDRRNMLMVRGAASFILLGLAVLALAAFALLARKWQVPELPARYGPVFRGSGNLTVSAVCFAAMLGGAALCLLRWKREGNAFSVWLGLFAVLAGCGLLSLSLDAYRKKAKGCTLLAAAMPVIFAVLLLISFYKKYAPIPAMLYTLYPFLALTADMVGLHLIAGFAGERIRPRWTVFFCGVGTVLSMISLPGVPETEVRIFLAAFALELFSHAMTLLTPREFKAEDFTGPAEASVEETAAAEAPAEEMPVEASENAAPADNAEAAPDEAE